jgi:hypothetical protein
MAGTTFTAVGMQFTLGVGYSFGSQTEGPRPSGDDPAVKSVSREFFSDLEYKYSSLKFVLGFSF